MSIIQSVKKLKGPKSDDIGYIITTEDNGSLEVSMTNGSLCCEKYGVFSFRNNKNYDKKLELLHGKVIDKIVILPIENDGDERSRNVELYFENDNDPFVMTLYNEHNGYYPHHCIIECTGIKNVNNENVKFKL